MTAPKSNSRTRDELFRIWSDMNLQIPPSVLMSYVNTGRVDALKLIRDEVSRVISGETKGIDPDVLRKHYADFLRVCSQMHDVDVSVFGEDLFGVSGEDSGEVAGKTEDAEDAEGVAGELGGDDSADDQAAEDPDAAAKRDERVKFTPMSQRRDDGAAPAPFKMMSRMKVADYVAERHGVDPDEQVVVRGVNAALLKELDSRIREGLIDAGAEVTDSPRTLPNGALLNTVIIALLRLDETGAVALGPGDRDVLDSVRFNEVGSRWNELFARIDNIERETAESTRLAKWTHPHMMELERNMFSGNLLTSMAFAERQGFIQIGRSTTDFNAADPVVLSIHDQAMEQADKELRKRTDRENRTAGQR